MSQTVQAVNAALPLKTYPILTNSGPAAKAKSALASAHETATSFADNVPNIIGYKDPDLTPQANSQFQDDLMDAHHESVTSKFNTVRGHLNDATTEAAKAAAPHKPVLDLNDANQLARTDQAWNNVIRPQLDAGKSLEDMINVADADQLLAIQRFAPAKVASDEPPLTKYRVPGILANLQTLSDQRVVDSATGDAKSAIDQEVETRGYANAAHAGMAQIEQARPKDVLQATMGIKRSANALKATPALIKSAS
jgi:hypothetical protein